MRTAAAWLGLLTLELIGAATLTLLCSDPSRWKVTAKLGLSFALGLVVLSVSLFLASWFGLKPVWWFGVVELLALTGLAVMFRREQCLSWVPRAAPDPLLPRHWSRGLAILLIAFIVAVCGVVGAVSLTEPLVEWDVIAIWALKGKVLLHESVRASPYFHDISKAYSHLDYPLLWPLAMAWVWSWAGRPDLDVVKVLAPALLCAFAAVFFGLLRRRNDVPRALLFTALLVGVPMVLSQISRLMADAPLSLFVCATFALCYLWVHAGHGDDLRLAGCFGAGMLFTKNEGIGFFAILLVVVGSVVAFRRKAKEALSAAVWLVGVPLLLTGAWFAFRSGIPKVHEDYGTRISPVFVFENASRVPQILRNSLEFFGNVQDWGVFWPVLAVALIVTARQWLRWPVLFLVMALAMVLSMYGYIYVVSPWQLDDLMVTTANRLLLHVAPLCVFLLAELLRSAGLLTVLGPDETEERERTASARAS